MKLTFNKQFNITQNDCNKLGYFNTLLVKDTKLFVDPFLLLENQSKVKEFKNSYSTIIVFFQKAFEMAAKGEGSIRKKLKDMLIFPEDNGFKLGYASSIYGAGGGKDLSESIIGQIDKTLDLKDKIPDHFEQISIFVDRVGCDTISDIVLNILKENFIQYTQRICKRLSIPMKSITVTHYKFNFKTLRWEDAKVQLPINAYTRQSIILVPKIFLKHLPTINPNAFSDYIWQKYNDTLKNDFSYDIKSKLDKKEIMKIAFESPNWVQEFIESENNKQHKPYDYIKDSHGLVTCTSESYLSFIEDCSNKARQTFSTQQKFKDMIEFLVDNFKHYIEEGAGYKGLWNEDSHKPESAVQDMLECYLYSLKEIFNFDLVRESKCNNGFLDFKFSSGNSIKVILETKYIDNSQFWNGFISQLPAYVKSEKAKNGTYLCVAFSDEDMNKFNKYSSEIKEIDKSGIIKMVLVDARKKAPPSKRKGKKQ